MALRLRIAALIGALAALAALAAVTPGAGASVVCSSGGANPSQCSNLPPLAVTADADQVSSETATLEGAVDGFGEQTEYYFQWGTLSHYSSTTPPGTLTPCLPAVADSPYCIAVPGTLVASTIRNLTPATTYHFRVLATNSYGTTIGSDESFTTTTLNPVQFVRAPPSNQPGSKFSVAVGLRVVAKLTISIQVRGRATSTRQILAQRVRTFHPSLTAPQSEGRYTIRVTASGGGTTQTIDATINVT